ncbi:sugar nucleotide-binding protein [Sphingomonas sp. KRR8]|uniref:family 1 glycosylhydrolase n=1 Tax=Sphingomonas sp. KRR8 TaxID=2942996 RepID=UPI002020DC7E|nr:family 1 glycosylhydrolase [Sphingomonas sp. KRR8]URD60520.1 sugar nucleotide-binding protein [Sphingomonas sp. KRR8]
MQSRETSTTPLELWGGVECTVVRIGDEYRDQLVETGHAYRMADLDEIARLGIRTVRYPIVWERVVGDHPDKLDFSWHDERLRRLRDLGVKVIGGLVHHGSGPRFTSLLDPDFPAKLGHYAAKVAERYPWIDRWTPVNEPLTTARFSCLYGHWYPHTKDWGAFMRALVLECAGSLLAMRAIRAVNPGALHVTTEDMGKTFATPALQHQANHENERRWLSMDLLAGRVGASHPFRETLERHADRKLLDLLATGEAAPDIIGINHYLTSERYLDERVDLYPNVEPGTNGRDTYVDLEAVRMPHLAEEVGPAARLREVWERYGIPLAITEVHHGCTREEQVRWLQQVWQAAEQVRSEGADVRAVTIWSLFGNVDWRSLITRREGIYDVGAFDTRGGKPRPTMVARAAASLATGGKVEHPIIHGKGWWQRPERFYIGASACEPAAFGHHPVLITGATGTLGQAFGRICTHRGLQHVVTDRATLDVTDAASIDEALDRLRPWAVINTAGFVRVPEAEHQPDDCFRINTTGPELLAAACHKRGIPFVTFSSDLVFDGQKGEAYLEPDPTSPACVYGRSKADAEQRVMTIDPRALIIRTSAFFGPWDRYNFLHDTLGRLHRGEEVLASDNSMVSPTYVPDLVHATLDLLLDGEQGIWHLANEGSVSWHGLARDIAGRAGMSPRKIVDSAGPRADNTLATSRGQLLRPLESALTDFMLHAETLPGR